MASFDVALSDKPDMHVALFTTLVVLLPPGIYNLSHYGTYDHNGIA